jgi:hypothetical protein
MRALMPISRCAWRAIRQRCARFAMDCGRISQSRVMDHAAFARDIEDAYRGMWQAWCANRSATPNQ